MKVVLGSRNRFLQAGGAIFTVMCLVALLSIVIVGFMLTALDSKESSRISVNQIEAAEVSKEATRLVIAQIQAATLAKDSGWASQPGVLRSWDRNGDFIAGYKLYSDEMMVEKDEKALLENDFLELQGEWESRPWAYVDLNEPTLRGDSEFYPVVNPEARDVAGIEGFDFNFKDSAKIEAAGNPLPMPVKWIYRLMNGSLGVLGEGKTFVPADGKTFPSRENPIVARFAFWTDDESCRLNPNVHAGGPSWSAPMAGGRFDRELASFAPGSNEAQRFPGHPATTSLGPVFAPGEVDLFYQKDEMDKIYGLVPRIVAGRSEAGKRTPDFPGSEPNGLVTDIDPILNSVDELVFGANREPREFPEGVGKGNESEFIDQARFFMSVHSNSPETTFGGLPRVSIWPTAVEKGPANSPNRTIHDDVLRSCAEFGLDDEGNRIGYHFQRKNADSSTVDFEGIRRNKELFEYLEAILSGEMVGIGKSFAAKYSKKERRQLLTEIFDYVRCTNLHDDNLYRDKWRYAYTDKTSNATNLRTFTNGRIGDLNQSVDLTMAVHKGHGQVTPIKINHGNGEVTKGMGRFHTFQEMGVQVIACAKGGDGKGGGGWVPADPGEEKGKRFSNFPPLPLTVDREDESTWPSWLVEMNSEFPDLVDKAFDSKNWNWQLAWLDPAYAAAMPSGKFDRSQLQNGELTRLKEGETLVQAAFLWSMVCPSLGRSPMSPDFVIDFEIDGMDFPSVDGSLHSIGWKTKPAFGISGPGRFHWATNRVNASRTDDIYGGFKLPHFFMKSARQFDTEIILEFPDATQTFPRGGRLTPLDLDFSISRSFDQYHFVTRPFRVRETVEMNLGNVRARIYASGGDALTEASGAQIATPELVQELTIPFAAFAVDAPELSAGFPLQVMSSGKTAQKIGPMAMWSLSWDGVNPEVSSVGRMAMIDHDHQPLFDFEDVVQTVGNATGDGRLVAVKPVVHADSKYFQSHRNYGRRKMAHSFQTTQGLLQRGATRSENAHVFAGAASYPAFDEKKNSSGFQPYGDFDSGVYLNGPGGWINKLDEGNGHFLQSKKWDPFASWAGIPKTDQRLGFGREHWYSLGRSYAIPSYYTPNRILNSPGMFGSLPVGTTENQAWRTMLFRPDVAGGSFSSHPGAETDQSPPDHLLLDLFWMPIVEPWSISETFSTKGKVNLNYQMLPFRHIKRDTALRGVFKSESILCVPNTRVKHYKRGFGRGSGYHWRTSPYGGSLQNKSLRAAIVEDKTLEQFEEKFTNTDKPTIFRTASEICDIHLVPEELGSKFGSEPIGSYQSTLEQMKNGQYWSDHLAVGDDARERPYSNIYSRVTTRSNVYRVYVIGEVVKQGRRENEVDYKKWNAELDQVRSQWQGSYVIERYLNLGDKTIPDYALQKDAPSLENFYRYRIVTEDRFEP